MKQLPPTLSSIRFLLVFFTLTLISILSGCIIEETVKPNKNTLDHELKISSAVSSQYPGFSPTPTTQYYLNPFIHLKAARETDVSDQTLGRVLGQIQQQLILQKHYQFSTEDKANYKINTYIVYGNQYSEQDLINTYGVAPELPLNTSYIRGTLILEITNLLGITVWHGAVQIYTDPNLEQSQSIRRTAYAIASLVRQIPNK